MDEAVFIGVDWGTSSARAFAFDRNGRVLARAQDSPSGALGVQSLRARLGRDLLAQDFSNALNQLLSGIETQGQMARNLVAFRKPLPPIIACGMVGSKQGLIDAASLPCPVSPLELSGNLVQADCDSFQLQIVPGLSSFAWIDPSTHIPDFMRGEETQLLGCLTQTPDEGVYVLPGSHSKWALLSNKTITRFETYLSGELFAAIKEHTIVGRLFASDRPLSNQSDAAENGPSIAAIKAFEKGLSLAQSNSSALQKHLFSTRALGLQGDLPPEQGEEFLSGLVIGHELLAGLQSFSKEAPIQIVGSDALCGRYLRAFQFYGAQATIRGNTSAAGLWSIYVNSQ